MGYTCTAYAVQHYVCAILNSYCWCSQHFTVRCASVCVSVSSISASVVRKRKWLCVTVYNRLHFPPPFASEWNEDGSHSWAAHGERGQTEYWIWSSPPETGKRTQTHRQRNLLWGTADMQTRWTSIYLSKYAGSLIGKHIKMHFTDTCRPALCPLFLTGAHTHPCLHFVLPINSQGCHHGDRCP